MRVNQCAIFVAGLLAVLVSSCSTASSTEGGSDFDHPEAEVRNVHRALDTAVIDQDWEHVRAAFAEGADMAFVGPPPRSQRLALTRTEMLDAFRADAKRPGYTRARTIQSVEIDPKRMIAVVRSVVEEHHRGGEQGRVSVLFYETAGIRFDSSPMTIVEYLGEIPRLPETQ